MSNGQHHASSGPGNADSPQDTPAGSGAKRARYVAPAVRKLGAMLDVDATVTVPGGGGGITFTFGSGGG